jgi:hypothetical protein
MGDARTRHRTGAEARMIPRRPGALDDLDDDTRDHLDRETAENIARGMTPDEAAAAAKRAFGNVMLTREAARAVCGGISSSRTPVTACARC